jgi:hypothetical protein
MKIELDGISLNEAQGGADGIIGARSVSDVDVDDNRNVVTHAVPGMEGSAVQDLGRTAVNVSFKGVVMGDSARSVMEMLRSRFKSGEPVSFNSDISGAADVTRVVIEDLAIGEIAGNVDRYDYSISLKEYVEPPQKQSSPPPQDEDAKKWMDDKADENDKGINNVTGKVLDVDGNPKKGITIKIKGEDEERTVETDEKGVYVVKDLPPGEYTIVADDTEYEGIEKNMKIGGSSKNEEEGES